MMLDEPCATGEQTETNTAWLVSTMAIATEFVHGQGTFPCVPMTQNLREDTYSPESFKLWDYSLPML